MVLEYSFLYDKFGSVLKCIRKAKKWQQVGESGHGPPPSHSYCNLRCELLHVRIINPKDLEVHPLGSTPGHTTIFELALLIDPICWLWEKGHIRANNDFSV